MQPYIGITGFTTSQEVWAVLSQIKLGTRPLMVGVLASSKTLRGEETRWPGRFPKIKDIKTIFPHHPNVLNLVHYHTSEQGNLPMQLRDIVRVGGHAMHGIQLNIAWPDVAALKLFCKFNPKVKLVLQVGSHAFEMVGESPGKLADKIQEYQGLIDHVLLDYSGGHGVPILPYKLIPFLEVLKSRNLGIGLGIAGGLEANSLRLLEPFARRFPEISIDAEGRLRDGQDHLVVSSAVDYFNKAQEMFSGVKEG